mgnify:CR=1 FL=1
MSILSDTKRALGLPAEYTPFDLDVTIGINASFLSLTQVGIGPEAGFMIVDGETDWDALLGGNPALEAVKQYVYLKTRVTFDPPNSSFVLEAMQKTLDELLWRLNIQVDKGLPDDDGTDSEL